MFSYVTMNALGLGPDGDDTEAESMGYIFDDPGAKQVTFDREKAGGFAFDGLGQIISEEQLERIDGMGGLGAGVTTLDKNADYLPAPPAGETWVYKGPNPSGTGHDWESAPADDAAVTDLAPIAEGPGFMDKHGGKVVMGVLAAAIVAFAFVPQRKG